MHRVARPWQRISVHSFMHSFMAVSQQILRRPLLCPHQLRSGRAIAGLAASLVVVRVGYATPVTPHRLPLHFPPPLYSPYGYNCVHHPFLVEGGQCRKGHSRVEDMQGWDHLTSEKQALVIQKRKDVEDRRAARQARRGGPRSASTNVAEAEEGADHEEASHVDMSHMYGQDDSSEPDTDSDDDTFHVDAQPYVFDRQLFEPSQLRSEGHCNESDFGDEFASPVLLEMARGDNSDSDSSDYAAQSDHGDGISSVNNEPASARPAAASAEASSQFSWCGVMSHILLVLVGVAVGLSIQKLAGAVVPADAAALRAQATPVPM